MKKTILGIFFGVFLISIGVLCTTAGTIRNSRNVAEQVKMIKKAREVQNPSQLRAYLGIKSNLLGNDVMEDYESISWDTEESSEGDIDSLDSLSINNSSFENRSISRRELNNERNRQGDSILSKISRLYKWNKYQGNPVIPEGSPDDWDKWKSDPFVMKEDGIYKIWYATNQYGSKTQIGYAESTDGIDWVHHPTPVVYLGDYGEWDDEDVETPTVLKHDGIYHLWYSARGEPEGTNPIIGYPEAFYRIGHATSDDGINWTKDPRNPVVGLGAFLTGWDWAAAAEPTVIFEDGMFKMWYVGATVISGKLMLQIGYATSPDGSHWNKYSDNPVISRNEFNGTATPTILHNKRYYELWYVIFDENTGLPAGPVKYAVSPNGTRWFVWPGIALEKGPSPEWDNYAIFGPTVLFDDEERIYKMWYTGVSIDFDVHLANGYATKRNIP